MGTDGLVRASQGFLSHLKNDPVRTYQGEDVLIYWKTKEQGKVE